MSKVGLAVVGLGYWGEKLLRTLAALPDARIVAVCDPVAERLAWAASVVPGARRFQALDDLLDLDGVEAAVIATPNDLHAAQARAFLTRGRHVFIEKPLALGYRDALGVVEAARFHRRVAMVGHTYLFNPAIRAARELIRSGAIGNPRLVSSQRLNFGRFQPDGGVVWALGPHDVSILASWFGAFPVAVRGRGHHLLNPDAGCDDVFVGDLEFPDGVTAHLHLSRIDPEKVRRMVVVGDEGSLILDDLDPEKGLVLVPRAENARELAEPRTIELSTRTPLEIEMADFLRCVRGEIPCESDADFGLKVVRVLEGMKRALDDPRVPLLADGAA